jgi:hypothetical protein
MRIWGDTLVVKLCVQFLSAHVQPTHLEIAKNSLKKPSHRVRDVCCECLWKSWWLLAE